MSQYRHLRTFFDFYQTGLGAKSGDGRGASPATGRQILATSSTARQEEVRRLSHGLVRPAKRNSFIRPLVRCSVKGDVGVTPG